MIGELDWNPMHILREQTSSPPSRKNVPLRNAMLTCFYTLLQPFHLLISSNSGLYKARDLS
jgi:hypothetical protein